MMGNGLLGMGSTLTLTLVVVFLEAVVSNSVIDLGIGWPDDKFLPLEAMRTAAESRMSSSRDPLLLQYSNDYTGNSDLKNGLGEFLSEEWGASVSSDNLIITSGVSGALDFLCTEVTSPGDIVLMESTSYFAAFDHCSLTIVTVEMDGDGIMIDALEAQLTEMKSRGEAPVLLYTIPVYHNPTSVTLAPERRAPLLGLARTFDFLVIADETYQLLNFTGTPPLPLPFYDDEADPRAVSVSTFSKIWAPGVRCGWIHAAPSLIRSLSHSPYLEEAGGMDPLTQGLMAEVLSLDLLRPHAVSLRAEMGVRARTLGTAVQAAFPEASPPVDASPDGGFFVWLCLPGQNFTTLAVDAADAGVSFYPGVRFSDGERFSHCARLCFARLPTGDLVEGVARLRDLVDMV